MTATDSNTVFRAVAVGGDRSGDDTYPLLPGQVEELHAIDPAVEFHPQDIPPGRRRELCPLGKGPADGLDGAAHLILEGSPDLPQVSVIVSVF